jgi:hypothetical protein
LNDFPQNPNATLPTLTHEGKSFTSTDAVINYLVSISSVEVAPKTSITTAVHSEKVDPNFAFVAAVRRFVCRSDPSELKYDLLQRNEEELAKVSGGFANVFMTTRASFL